MLGCKADDVKLLRILDTLSYADRALLEPLVVAIYLVWKAAIKPGAICLVIRAGVVGLLYAAVAKFSGYSPVVMADITFNRLAFTLKNGFADDTLALVPRRPSGVEEGLEFSKEDAAAIMAKNQGDKFTRTFKYIGGDLLVRSI
jgi:threonine dehydrogenase-like Zn-dependent dehydrogenase